jgi:ATP/maltotriose-dependent transcriptional regulator MalT
VLILRGDTRAGRPGAERFVQLAAEHGFAVSEVEGRALLAQAADADGRPDEARRQCELLLDRLAEADDRHYVLPVLRWTATFMAGQDDGEAVRRCAAALAERAPGAGQREALSALAHVLGEVALLDGDAATAADRFEAALAELDRLEIPWDRALTAMRAGVAHAALGDAAAARRRLEESLAAARRLGARPLAARVAVELQALAGQPRTTGRAAATAHGLTRRELEVLQHVAAGRTNREIAGALVLSPRTIEMHVQNALGKLGCRGRAEASARAASLGLLDADAAQTP